jgi:hypothetical protein
MADQDNMTESGLTVDNAQAIKDELSGEFTKANSLGELDRKAPPVADQSTDKSNEEDESGGSIGLSTDEKSSSDDASDDRGEEDGSSASSSTPADEASDESESEDSPFTTVEDSEHDENTDSYEEEDDIPDEEYFEDLSNRIGFEVTSEEDVVTLVRNLAEKDPLEGLSPLLQKAAEFESNGGDVREYFNVLSVNTDNLSEKEAMWHKFKSENSTLSQDSPEFARQKFERDFNTKYKILSDQRAEDDFDTDEEYAAFKSNQAYAKEELQWESNTAKRELAAERDDALASAPPQAQVNQEESARVYQEYLEEASYYKENFETLSIPIDKEGKTHYNIGLNEKSRPIYESFLDSPAKLLDYIGIGSDQKSIDAEAFAQNAALLAAFAVDGEFSVGAQFANAMTERLNRNSVETRLENPAPEGGKSNSGGEGGQGDLSEAVEALRNDMIKQRRM